MPENKQHEQQLANENMFSNWWNTYAMNGFLALEAMLMNLLMTVW